MSADLDTLIAERLGIPEEQARDLLRAMLEEVRNRAEDDEVRLPRLGTFQEEDGTLSFSPSPSLERLVNQQYEGLRPEEVPARPEVEPEDPDRAEPDDEPERPPPEEPLSDESKEAPPSSQQDEPDPSPGVPDYPLVEEDLRYDTGQPDAPEERREDESEFKPSADQPTGGSESGTEQEEDTERRPPRQTSIVDSFRIIVGILLLVFLIAAGWFVLNQTHMLPSFRGAGTEATQSAGSATDTAVAETDGQASAPQDTVAEQTQPARFPGTTPGEPDTRNRINPSTGGWTIVVASTPDRSVAERTREQYRQQFSGAGLPVDVVTGTVNNGTRHRVAVGQYTSRDAALQALDQHAARLPEGAWVLRL